jgi:hypothetical protein
MKRCYTILTLSALLVFCAGTARAADEEAVKWYGVGGEISGSHRWLGRIGINEYLGTEVIFAMNHMSYDCPGGDCDSTTLDVGAGVIYEVLPGATISPYLAGRFILTMTGNGESENSGTVEAAAGVEYLIMRRLGLSGELNFNFRTDPTRVGTTTVLRFHLYF